MRAVRLASGCFATFFNKLLRSLWFIRDMSDNRMGPVEADSAVEVAGIPPSQASEDQTERRIAIHYHCFTA